MTANAGDHLDLMKDNLPVSSISVFLIGYVTEQVQDNDNLFKSIKLTVSEFVGEQSMVNKFFVKCIYLKVDERIDNKVKKLEKIRV